MPISQEPAERSAESPVVRIRACSGPVRAWRSPDLTRATTIPAGVGDRHGRSPAGAQSGVGNRISSPTTTTAGSVICGFISRMTDSGTSKEREIE